MYIGVHTPYINLGANESLPYVERSLPRNNDQILPCLKEGNHVGEVEPVAGANGPFWHDSQWFFYFIPFYLFLVPSPPGVFMAVLQSE